VAAADIRAVPAAACHKSPPPRPRRIEAHFGPLRQFTLANSNHPNHTVRTRVSHAYLRWRNQNARHPDVLAAQRRERARIRIRIRRERGIRWGGSPLSTVACLRTPVNLPGHSTQLRAGT
jgi:hypothetical protein